jgi:putative drug exporter of the RND superfamily
MYALLGKAIARAWPLWLAGWAALLLLCRWAAPPWNEFARSSDEAFLPADSPSRAAAELTRNAFPDQHSPSNVVVVLHRNGGLQDADRNFIADSLAPALATGTNGGHDAIIARIRTFQEQGVGALLISPDREASIVLVSLKQGFLEPSAWSAVDAIERQISRLRDEGRIPAGLQVDLTGSAAIGRDVMRAEARSAEATRAGAILLVVAILLLIYRAPLLLCVCLATVYVGVNLSLHLLALLAQAGVVNLFEGAQIYVTVLGYGAGVDYCIFITARYKEELARGASARAGVANAIGHVGAALTASAATVIVGIGMMALCSFGKFRAAGLLIPLAVGVVLLAALTLSPALLALAGRWAFWPHFPPADNNNGSSTSPHGDPLNRFWQWIGRLLLRRPGSIWLGALAALAPFAVVGVLWRGDMDYNLIDNLAVNAPSARGTQALRKHFAAGLLGPTTVLVENHRLDFHDQEGEKLIASVTAALKNRSDELGLADVRSLTAPLGVAPAAAQAFATPGRARETIERVVHEGAQRYYIGAEGNGHATRLELIFVDQPFANDSIDRLGQVERALGDSVPAPSRPSTRLFYSGATANLRDLEAVTARDQRLIGYLVPAAVFVVLSILLRRLAVALYLILSVLFSYLATLGVTVAVFAALQSHGFNGLDWRVPVFLFTILVAVGEDYNIFLLTRVHEEQRRHGRVQGVVDGLAQTGSVISSCGLIMAGSFASLMLGQSPELKQMGFALAFGVLLDALVVRTVLAPAFLVLYEKFWNGDGRIEPATKKND